MNPPPGGAPEELARENIDANLVEAGWTVQDLLKMNLAAGPGVAVREFPLTTGHADYLLFVDEQPIGALEAKPEGHTLSGVEIQADKYASGLPPALSAPVLPLPFLYLSTGVETTLTNLLDPEPRSRNLFHFHRPETIREWLDYPPLPGWVQGWTVKEPAVLGGQYGTRPSSFRSRLRAMPPVDIPGLWANKKEAITNLEESLWHDRPRSLIQMATGSGKTLLAITAIYRLIKFGGARRVLFLVDRTNLGEQAEKEFQAYRTPDDNRKFTELYNVQRLTSNHIMDSSRVVITTVQRLFSMLKGEELDPEAEDGSQFDTSGQILRDPAQVAYNAGIPVEFFDVLFVDECHRSIYSLWRQVLEYFDAHLIGLTATPAKHTFGFFHQNLVMEYSHERAVADGVNVDFDVYRIRTRITEQGSTIEAEPDTVVGVRERETRRVRWEKPDEDITYSERELDRNVVAKDQIRKIVQTFRDKLFTEIFPGRKEIPKTLVFAKDDSHAEDIVEILREEFGKGNDFCQKITYKTTGKKPADLIQDFRNSFNPRIAVTVDMIATGTDIKPVEIVMFMRTVRSRIYFEQMKGRGVRVIDRDELRSVTPDAVAKDHFVLVDCVGLPEEFDPGPTVMDRKKNVSLKALLNYVAAGSTDPEVLSTLASRLARLERKFDPEDKKLVRDAAGGSELAEISLGMVQALDPDRHIERAREEFEIPDGEEPTEEQVGEAATRLAKEAVRPLATNPKLRTTILELKKKFEQIIDEISQDEVIEAGFSAEAKERAKTIVESFERFIEENKDEITALQVFFSQPYGQQQLTFEEIRTLADTIQAPPRSWTPQILWRAYETLQKDRVRGASPQRLLTDLVSLVRYALHQEDELVPYPEKVEDRFQTWMAQQQGEGRSFTREQVRWLNMIRDHIATSLEIETDDFDYAPFAEQGGLGKAAQVFGKDLRPLLDELNEALAA